MDAVKMGLLIRQGRRERGWTQWQLAQKLHVSDKAVSKWERGFGCPDVAVLPAVAEQLGVSVETLLAGGGAQNRPSGGNLKRLRVYVCPRCGNVLTAVEEAAVACCGGKLTPLVPQKADEAHTLSAEKADNEWYLTTAHPMERAHYIAFVALLTGDSVLIRRQYPEWELQAHLPWMGHARLLWYCTEHGLFYRDL